MPGRGDQENDGQAAEGAQTFPNGPGKQLACSGKVNDGGGGGEDDADQALQQESHAKTRGQEKGPAPRMRLVFVDSAKESPHREGDGKHQHDVGNQDAGEQKQTHAGGHAEAGVKAGAFAERPRAESRGEPGEGDGRKRDGDTRGPIGNAEYFIGEGDGPINERGLFEIGDAVDARRDPIAGGEHISRDLSLHRVDVVHERGRRNDAAEVDGGGEEYDG